MYSLKRLCTVAALFLTLGAVTIEAQGQQLKIGYTDPDLLVSAMPRYQQIQQQLQQEYNANQEALKSLAADFQEKVDKYQKQQPLLSAERRAEREAALQQEQLELQQAASQKDEEMNKRQTELLSPLLTEVQNAIDEVSQAKGLALVLKAPALIYVDSTLVVDITKEVAVKLGIPLNEGQTASTGAGNASN